MRSITVISILTFLIMKMGFTANGQSYYIPRNIKQAFDKGTRSVEGKPGKNYWQNGANYAIRLKVSPPGKTIEGNEEIIYFNNSPDTLHKIIVRLIENNHKPEATRSVEAYPGFFNSGIHISSFKINGEKQEWNDPTIKFTVNEIALNKPLLPHDSIHFYFEWNYELTYGEREGITDSTTFFLAYFYPRIGVYDDYEGWDKNDFTGRQEFYNDFNNYLLTITLPDNFLVWSTGTLENPEEVLQPAICKKLEHSKISDEIIHLVNKKELWEKNVTIHRPQNSWKWKADYVPDVAMCISDHFIWDATSMVADSMRTRVQVESVYNDTAPDFRYVAAVSKQALEFLSHQLPGVAYPYPKMTVCQGYADMEYPMFVNDQSYDTYREMQWTTYHEVAHSYFPFYMGTNENRFAFMDEGWATFLELAMERDGMPYDTAMQIFTGYRLIKYAAGRSMDVDVPIMTPSDKISGNTYSLCSYIKPALANWALFDLLGEQLFKKCLREYIQRWNGKHPIPYDFFNSFNTSSGKNLDWFWSNWYFSNYHIDLEIKGVDREKEGNTITISNTGGFAVPLDLEIKFKGGQKVKLHRSPEVWKQNNRQIKIYLSGGLEIQSIAFRSELFFNADSTKNNWTNTVNK